MASILPLEDLLKEIEVHRPSKKIIFTNGCFDILHIGHIDVLTKAKSIGDILIVGLNSDNSVKSLKGPKRPIISELSRAIVLSHLDMIDYVVMFDEETPLKLIEAIKPDCLVKGGDYQIEQVIGHDIVKETILVPIFFTVSTSKIIEKILDNPTSGGLSCQDQMISLQTN